MKPLIKYRGGKSREIPNILQHIPRFSGRYVEPFFGGGALFFYLEPRQAIINDINLKLMNFYQSVRDDYINLRAELDVIEQIYTKNRLSFEAEKAKSPEARVEDKNEQLYYHLRDMFNGVIEKTYSDAFLYYFINKTSYSGMIRYNSKGEFNVPYGRYKHLNTTSVTKSHSKLLQRAELYNLDYKKIFNLCHQDDFVFLDPPYDCVFSDYGNEEYKGGFNEESHIRLYNDFKKLPCKAMMVIGKTPLIESLYKQYIIDEYDKNYSVNIRNRFKAAAKHVVITNYKKDVECEKFFHSDYNMNNKPEVSQLRFFEKIVPYGKNK